MLTAKDIKEKIIRFNNEYEEESVSLLAERIVQACNDSVIKHKTNNNSWQHIYKSKYVFFEFPFGYLVKNEVVVYNFYYYLPSFERVEKNFPHECLFDEEKKKNMTDKRLKKLCIELQNRGFIVFVNTEREYIAIGFEI